MNICFPVHDLVTSEGFCLLSSILLVHKVTNSGNLKFDLSERRALPTKSQSDAAIFMCQLLSNLYQPIQVFRDDRELETLYIQAGANDEIAVIINSAGIWEFVL